MLRTEEQVEEVKNFELKNFEFDPNKFYASYAQAYEYVGKFDKALEYWNLNLEKGYKENFFYYRRPIELLFKKMNKPQEAIKFAEISINKFPSGILAFNYYIAIISAENNIEIDKGLKAINYCISNYKENGTFNLDEAKILKEKIAKLKE